MPNLEIKARYADLSRAREVAKKLGAERIGLDHQVDTYFKTESGRLKLREASLTGSTLIPYWRPDESGPKLSDYMLVPIRDPSRLGEMLKKLLGVEIIVEKEREIFILGNVRIHIDEVKGLGKFVEFEAVFDEDSKEAREEELKKIKQLMTDFSIGERLLEKGSYRELARKSEKPPH